jgi:hypothetical protein
MIDMIANPCGVAIGMRTGGGGSCKGRFLLARRIRAPGGFDAGIVSAPARYPIPRCLRC